VSLDPTFEASLATHPFIILLTLPRILRHLNMYKRPEPEPVNWSAFPSRGLALAKGWGIGWQQPTILERPARHSVNAFLVRRAHALGVRVCIKLQLGDPPAQAHDSTPVPTGQMGNLGSWHLVPQIFPSVFDAARSRRGWADGAALGQGRRPVTQVRELLVSVFDQLWCARIRWCYVACARDQRSAYCLTLRVGMSRMLEVGEPASAYARELDGSGRVCCATLWACCNGMGRRTALADHLCSLGCDRLDATAPQRDGASVLLKSSSWVWASTSAL
jgi:hypothetical protein